MTSYSFCLLASKHSQRDYREPQKLMSNRFKPANAGCLVPIMVVHVQGVALMAKLRNDLILLLQKRRLPCSPRGHRVKGLIHVTSRLDGFSRNSVVC
jgi:hypothetical protein